LISNQLAKVMQCLIEMQQVQTFNESYKGMHQMKINI
jgi:hypothetical protein